ncbi:MAG: ribonuclease E activity regulator RraA [Gammaproteobacteria bacterium]|nr:ribonuclease E activity regulator RraA [Gammaproteobacteria bacterium]NNF49826.1 ribonuclease E activity regulator RraA [Woeseiaceae bacterium]MBT8093729.1 ribonuclease E activity regulator RraA [Gammaproteobacteria bacterium]MBT8105654.1 ribonuclease E activity regulator RraA [Gammaproteobacteria bacterium]NNK25668.1 ribonuclease E activity regulator RraA [Woeseiaceae bacterium]
MRPTTDLYDDYEDEVETCSVLFRDFGGRREFCGPVRTVKCLNDNSVFRELLNEPGNGGVIVVDGQGSTEKALMGDMLAAKGAANGWSGVIIHGVIRDSAEIAGIEIGVKALGTNPAKSIKEGKGEVDCPVEFGGVRFEPGAWVYCDADGVLVSPKDIA